MKSRMDEIGIGDLKHGSVMNLYMSRYPEKYKFLNHLVFLRECSNSEISTRDLCRFGRNLIMYFLVKKNKFF